MSNLLKDFTAGWLAEEIEIAVRMGVPRDIARGFPRHLCPTGEGTFAVLSADTLSARAEVSEADIRSVMEAVAAWAPQTARIMGKERRPCSSPPDALWPIREERRDYRERLTRELLAQRLISAARGAELDARMGQYRDTSK